MTPDELHALIDAPDLSWRQVLHRLVDAADHAASASQLEDVRQAVYELGLRVTALPAPVSLDAVHAALEALTGKVEALEAWRAAQVAADTAPPPAAGRAGRRPFPDG